MAHQMRTQRKDKTWTNLEGLTQAFTVATTIGPSAIAFSTKATVIRMLGEYVVTPTTAPDAQDQCAIGVGIIVVADDVIATGGGALPDPIDDLGLPWLYWAIHMFRFPSTSIEGAAGSTVLRKSFDIRSMRKVTNGQSLALIVQYADGTGLPPVTFSMSQTRVLIAT